MADRETKQAGIRKAIQRAGNQVTLSPPEGAPDPTFSQEGPQLCKAATSPKKECSLGPQ